MHNVDTAQEFGPYWNVVLSIMKWGNLSPCRVTFSIFYKVYWVGLNWICISHHFSHAVIVCSGNLAQIFFLFCVCLVILSSPLQCFGVWKKTQHPCLLIPPSLVHSCLLRLPTKWQGLSELHLVCPWTGDVIEPLLPVGRYQPGAVALSQCPPTLQVTNGRSTAGLTFVFLTFCSMNLYVLVT